MTFAAPLALPLPTDTVTPLMANAEKPHSVPAPLVGVAAWLVPGAGYALLGQWARALTVGITIIVLFVLGLLIGGIRSIEVPGYDGHGQKLIVSTPADKTSNVRETVSPRVPDGSTEIGWALTHHP